jgi:hypothetical protein
MNPYLEARLKVSSGTYFHSVSDDAAEVWAIQDALGDVMRWYKGLEPDKTLHKALNAIEDMYPGTKTRQLTDEVRHCILYEDEYRELQFRKSYPTLRLYVMRNRNSWSSKR